MTDKCVTPYCKNKAREGRKICNTCDSRRKRSKNPMRAAFEALRFNSRRRGKVFNLSWDEFKQFCRETVYMAGKGRNKPCFTIDRIDDSKGYTANNIQVLSKSMNSAKAKKKLVYDWEYPEHAFVANY